MTDDYQRFTGPGRVDKAINMLSGIVQGISIDGVINPDELHFIHLWLADHRNVRDRHPFNEVVPLLAEAVRDGILTADERADILWLCKQVTSTSYYDELIAGIQQLHGILAGIVADGMIHSGEIQALREWVNENEHLKTLYPYDEVESVINEVLRDGVIDADEHGQLLALFAEFAPMADSRTIIAPVQFDATGTLTGVCAMNPEITFDGMKFCLTGEFARGKRSDVSAVIADLGGRPMSNVSSKTHFLVVGAEGNPSWKYACYGRKVEEAIRLRREGARISIVHEIDLFDAVADFG